MLHASDRVNAHPFHRWITLYYNIIRAGISFGGWMDGWMALKNNPFSRCLLSADPIVVMQLADGGGGACTYYV